MALSHYIMAVMYDRMGQLDKAVEEYKRALKADYANPVIHLNLAATYLCQNNFDKAVEELKLASSFDPQSAEPHAILALIYSLQKKGDLASAEYEAALKNASRLQPKNIEIYKNLGIFYLQQKNFQAAQNVYQMVLELSSEDPEAHFYLADVYNELGDKQKAEDHLKKALGLKADYPEALNFLGYLYVEQNKNLDKAEVMIKKALEQDPDNGAYVDSLGWLYFRKGKIDAAKKQLIRAAGLLEDPVIFDHLGDVYLAVGDEENSLLYWEKSLKLDPDQAGVREKLDRLQKQLSEKN